MTVSSAAGYQLRKHYQNYILALECEHTGADMQSLIEFSENQKKVRKNRNRRTKPGDPPADGATTPGAPGDPGAPMEQGSAPSIFLRSLFRITGNEAEDLEGFVYEVRRGAVKQCGRAVEAAV